MEELGNKSVLVGHLLDVMKYADDESRRLEEAGITVGVLDSISNKIWDSIKIAVGMPEEEELGVWISDYWLGLVTKYENGEISKEEAISGLVSWKEYKD